MAPSTLANSPSTTEQFRQHNGDTILELCALGEKMLKQAGLLPPESDPLTVALNGFPDVNTSRDYYACNREG